MQTFLPFDSFELSLDSLDNKRLNKQILETYQILNILSGQTKTNAWKNHPAVLMWTGSERNLYDYGMTAIRLASSRGIKTDKNASNIADLKKKAFRFWGNDVPLWKATSEVLNRVNMTHRANLYIKDPEFYFDFAGAVSDPNNSPCCDRCKYFWVTHTL